MTVEADGDEGARSRVLDAAENLFYGRGIRTVGMDDLRAASGVPLKRIYGLFGSKEELVVAYLNRRNTRWMRELQESVMSVDEPSARLLAIFGWLHDWFASATFNGCAWVNAHGELGSTSPTVVSAVRTHKNEFRRLIKQLVEEADLSNALSPQIYLLAEGAIVAAAIDGRPDAALQGRDAAAALVTANRKTTDPAGAVAPPSAARIGA